MMLQCSLLSLIILIVVDDTINLLSGYRPGIITITLIFLPVHPSKLAMPPNNRKAALYRALASHL